MIVMKFGGTSLADAERILAAADIVRGRMGRKPVVVVSALAGVTDLLIRAAATATGGPPEATEPILAELIRRHRWAVSGSVRSAAKRHDLDLAVDALFKDLRQRLRSVRVLGEGTPRAADGILATGEILSATIVTAVLADRGLPARALDAREIVITDERHGAASADLAEVEARAAAHVRPVVDAGEVPVLGGFYGATPDGRTTTLGRGGSDTSAALLGCALMASEIEIWTDVDGIMTADPKRVTGARTRACVSFADAAELAFYGAKVLHPASVAPAVARGIPVRVLNTWAPERPGTVVVQDAPPGAPPFAAIASRGGISLVRVSSRTLRIDAAFLAGVAAAIAEDGLPADLAAACETGVGVALPTASVTPSLVERLASRGAVTVAEGQAVVCVVGHGLAGAPETRAKALAAIARHAPEMVVLGGSTGSVAAVFPEPSVGEVLTKLHRTLFEDEEAAA